MSRFIENSLETISGLRNLPSFFMLFILSLLVYVVDDTYLSSKLNSYIVLWEMKEKCENLTSGKNFFMTIAGILSSNVHNLVEEKNYLNEKSI